MFLGSAGGCLLEFYILSYGLECDSKLLTKRLNHQIDDVVYDSQLFFRRYAAKFWMFAAQSMYRIYRQCSMPLIHFAMQQQFRGLSRVGQKMGDVLGTTSSLSTFTRKSKELIAVYTDDVNEMAQSNHGIMTLDNYCHVYGSGNINLARDSSYSKCNYTVVAVSAYDFAQRPSFKWTFLGDPDTLVASLPMLLIDLLDFKDKVTLF